MQQHDCLFLLCWFTVNVYSATSIYYLQASLIFSLLILYSSLLAPLWQQGLLFTFLLSWLTIIASKHRQTEAVLVFDHLYQKPGSSGNPVAKAVKGYSTVCRYQFYFAKAATWLEKADNLFKYVTSSMPFQCYYIYI